MEKRLWEKWIPMPAVTFKLCYHIGEKMREKWRMEHTPNVDFDPERNN